MSCAVPRLPVGRKSKRDGSSSRGAGRDRACPVPAGVGSADRRGKMARVLGIGGVFFKAKDPATLTHWYRDVIGIELEDWGGIVFRPEAMAAHPGAATVFSAFDADTTYFEPSAREFMINLA